MEHHDWRGFLEQNVPHLAIPLPHWAGLLIRMIGFVMSTQDQINAAVAELVAARNSEAASLTQLQADVQSVITILTQGAQPVDATGVQAAAADATADAQTLADTVQQLHTAVTPPAPTA